MSNKKTEDPALILRRSHQLKAAKEALDRAQLRRSDLRSQQKTHKLLVSVAKGLYMELDKLNKKAPVEQITKLMCNELNELISDATKLMKSDPYVGRVKPFVAAGENPENRDALIVLRTLLQGFERNEKELAELASVNANLLIESGTLHTAVGYWLQHKEVPDAKALQINLSHRPSEEWLEESNVYNTGPRLFAFDRLDALDNLPGYFASLGDDVKDDEGAQDEDGEDDENEENSHGE